MKKHIQKVDAGIRASFSWKALLISLCTFVILMLLTTYLVPKRCAAEAQSVEHPASMVDPLVRETKITIAVNAFAAALNNTGNMTMERVREYDENVVTVEAAQAFYLYLMGFSDREIAESTGQGVQAVRDWRTANCLLPGAPMHSMEYLLKKAADREWALAYESNGGEVGSLPQHLSGRLLRAETQFEPPSFRSLPTPDTERSMPNLSLMMAAASFLVLKLCFSRSV